MRFFSNDARESADDQPHDEPTPDQEAAGRPAQDEQPGRVQSQSVAVPHQRPPSPWSNTPPAAGEAAVADPDRDGVPCRDDSDPPPFHEPSPQPTAFGASTVGGAVAASAMANPQNDHRDATDRDSTADTGVGDDANVAPGDGVVTSSTATYAGGTVTPPDTPATWTGPDARDSEPVVDLPLDDAAERGERPAGAVAAGDVTDRDRNQDDAVTTFDDTDRSDDRDRAHDRADRADHTDRADDHTDPVASAALKDDGGFADPRSVDPATDTPLDSGDTSADSTPPTVVAVPVAAAPAAAAAAESDALFDPDDARSLQERWRDVQLRFVDSPKDAAGDAAKLVDEAVEKLSTRLRSQREGLGNDTDDTEQLRVQLRAYRDILNRILSL